MKHQPNSLLDIESRNALKQVFLKMHDVCEKQLNELVNLFELVSYKKNFEIIKENEKIEYVYFVYSGIVKVYFYKNNKLIIERFEIEGGFFGGDFSAFSKKPNINIYESVEDVVLLRIRHSELYELCNKSHAIERIYRITMELFHSSFVERYSTFKALTSEERYHELIKNFGNIANRVPLKDIANYLDMTPETLSRIRAKYDKRATGK